MRPQGFIFINFDRDMRDPKTREWARCRNSNLNEDLGKVSGCGRGARQSGAMAYCFSIVREGWGWCCPA